MNFYNPYFYSLPTTTSSSLLGKLSFSSLLSGSTKALNFVNQAIPIVKQMSPLIKNAKTMFQVMNEFKKTEPTNQEEILEAEVTELEKNPTNGPTFFI